MQLALFLNAMPKLFAVNKCYGAMDENLSNNVIDCI